MEKVNSQDYCQMKSELELIKTLLEADDVKNRRIEPIQDSFDNLRVSLLESKIK